MIQKNDLIKLMDKISGILLSIQLWISILATIAIFIFVFTFKDLHFLIYLFPFWALYAFVKWIYTQTIKITPNESMKE